MLRRQYTATHFQKREEGFKKQERLTRKMTLKQLHKGGDTFFYATKHYSYVLYAFCQLSNNIGFFFSRDTIVFSAITP